MPDGAVALAAPGGDDLSVAEAARSLVGGRVDRLERVSAGGRNSRVYRVRCGGASFALKHYPDDGRNRLQTEIGALALMARHGVAEVPRIMASDPIRGYALLTWIDGDGVNRPAAPDIDAAIGFLAKVHALRHRADAALQPFAAEACFSGAEIAAQIDRRCQRLADAAQEDRGLGQFLERLSGALAATVLPQATTGYDRLGLAFLQPVAPAARSLCPADFGFHNARRGAGGLRFLDFEYFGWDDPAKLVCDFLLHPGTVLPAPLQRRFAAAVAAVYGDCPGFADRVRLLYPLFAIRWCLILLNEFLPERWATRVHAGDGDWRSAKQRQLVRAAHLFDTLQTDNWRLAA